MARYARIPLENDIEAQLLAAVLEEEGIPHFTRSFHDSAYDGLFQTQLGWGYMETPPGEEERVAQILQGIRSSRTES
jgi:hypothetical protein